MSTIRGQVTAAIIAGHIEATNTAPNKIGQQIAMAGSGVMLYITADVARQWLPVITQIAEGNQ